MFEGEAAVSASWPVVLYTQISINLLFLPKVLLSVFFFFYSYNYTYNHTYLLNKVLNYLGVMYCLTMIII